PLWCRFLSKARWSRNWTLKATLPAHSPGQIRSLSNPVPRWLGGSWSSIQPSALSTQPRNSRADPAKPLKHGGTEGAEHFSASRPPQKRERDPYHLFKLTGVSRDKLLGK